MIIGLLMEPNRLDMKPSERAAMMGGTPVAIIMARKAEYRAPTWAVCRCRETKRHMSRSGEEAQVESQDKQV